MKNGGYTATICRCSRRLSFPEKQETEPGIRRHCSETESTKETLNISLFFG